MRTTELGISTPLAMSSNDEHRALHAIPPSGSKLKGCSRWRVDIIEEVTTRRYERSEIVFEAGEMSHPRRETRGIVKRIPGELVNLLKLR